MAKKLSQGVVGWLGMDKKHVDRDHLTFQLKPSISRYPLVMPTYTFRKYRWQDRSQIGTDNMNLDSWLSFQRSDFQTNTRLVYKNNVLTKQWLVCVEVKIVKVDDSDDEIIDLD